MFKILADTLDNPVDLSVFKILANPLQQNIADHPSSDFKWIFTDECSAFSMTLIKIIKT